MVFIALHLGSQNLPTRSPHPAEPDTDLEDNEDNEGSDNDSSTHMPEDPLPDLSMPEPTSSFDTTPAAQFGGSSPFSHDVSFPSDPLFASATSGAFDFGGETWTSSSGLGLNGVPSGGHGTTFNPSTTELPAGDDFFEDKRRRFPPAADPLASVARAITTIQAPGQSASWWPNQALGLYKSVSQEEQFCQMSLGIEDGSSPLTNMYLNSSSASALWDSSAERILTWLMSLLTLPNEVANIRVSDDNVVDVPPLMAFGPFRLDLVVSLLAMLTAAALSHVLRSEALTCMQRLECYINTLHDVVTGFKTCVLRHVFDLPAFCPLEKFFCNIHKNPQAQYTDSVPADWNKLREKDNFAHLVLTENTDILLRDLANDYGYIRGGDTPADSSVSPHCLLVGDHGPERLLNELIFPFLDEYNKAMPGHKLILSILEDLAGVLYHGFSTFKKSTRSNALLAPTSTDHVPPPPTSRSKHKKPKSDSDSDLTDLDESPSGSDDSDSSDDEPAHPKQGTGGLSHRPPPKKKSAPSTEDINPPRPGACTRSQGKTKSANGGKDKETGSSHKDPSSNGAHSHPGTKPAGKTKQHWHTGTGGADNPLDLGPDFDSSNDEHIKAAAQEYAKRNLQGEDPFSRPPKRSRTEPSHSNTHAPGGKHDFTYAPNSPQPPKSEAPSSSRPTKPSTSNTQPHDGTTTPAVPPTSSVGSTSMAGATAAPRLSLEE
ncbi:unnamed protein product [Peniophora sp. CBMAI 1063]|nr:unnamed protein product [Peniophora sp. CBMAI 1063]